MSGKPLVSDSSLRAIHRKTPLLCHNDENGKSDKPLPVKDLRVDKGLFLRVDLQGNADEGQAVVGYRAKKNSHIIDLSMIGLFFLARCSWKSSRVRLPFAFKRVWL